MKVLILLISAMCVASTADPIYVGSCVPTGYSTIQSAVNEATSGQLIIVCPGTSSRFLRSSDLHPEVTDVA